MNLLLLNQTDTQLSYLQNQIIVPASGNSSVNFGLVPYLALDPIFVNDLIAQFPKVYVSDGTNIYMGVQAQTYLATWLASGPAQNSNDPVAFTLAGKGFSVTGNASLNSTNETPVILLTNPANSGVNARAMFFYAAPNSTQGIVTIKIYTNPTASNNGTVLPIQNNLVSAASPVSAMNAYAAPSLSNNGTNRITVVTNANADSSLFNFAQTAVLAPGNSMLMTITVSNIGLLASVNTYFYMQWVEA